VYSVIKIIPFERWFPSVAWKHIERALLVVGVLGAFVSLSTGEVAEELFGPNRQLVEAHAFFASLATWLYGILLAGEVLLLANPVVLPKIGFPLVTKILEAVRKLITHNVVAKLLAVFGLVAITLTGLLGGVMVYGTTADPLAGFVLQILNISL